jgi:hypothetical protein
MRPLEVTLYTGLIVFTVVFFTISIRLKNNLSDSQVKRTFRGFCVFLYIVLITEIILRFNDYWQMKFADGLETIQPQSEEKGGLGNDHRFDKYRIGDLWRLGHDGISIFFYANAQTTATNYHQEYVGTIAKKYSKCIGPFDKRNTDCMKKVLDEVCPHKTLTDPIRGKKEDITEFINTDTLYATSGTTIFHLRLGDILENPIFQMVTGSPEEDHMKAIDRIAKKGGERILFVGGIHKKNVSEEKSTALIERIEKHAHDKGLKTMVISNDPDTDLCVLSRAKRLVSQPKSGFSMIAQSVARKNGADVMPVTNEADLGSDRYYDSELLIEKNIMLILCVPLAVMLVIGIIRYWNDSKSYHPPSKIGERMRWIFACLVFVALTLLTIPIVLPREDRGYRRYFMGSTFSRRWEDTDPAYVVVTSYFLFFSFLLWFLTNLQSGPYPLIVTALLGISFMLVSYTKAVSTYHNWCTAFFVLSLILMARMGKTSGWLWLPCILLFLISYIATHFALNWESTTDNEKIYVSSGFWFMYYLSQLSIVLTFFIWVYLNTIKGEK